MSTFSASKLSQFEQCPRRYFYTHVARLPGEPSVLHPATFMGSRVHEALEHLYQERMGGRTPSQASLLEWFGRRWSEAWQLEPAAVPSWDSAERWVEVGSRCLAWYYARYSPFDEEVTLATERFVEFPLDAEGTIRFRGFIDRLARAPDGTIRIHDYKTQKDAPTQAAIEADEQLSFYEMAVRHELGHDGPVELIWHFLRAEVSMTSQRTREALEQLRARSISRIRIIDSLGALEGDYEPHPSRLCQWCEHRAGCPAAAAPGERR